MTEFTTKITGDKAVIQVSGELGEKAAEDLKAQFTELLAKKMSEVVVDLYGVDFMGSSAIGKILLFYKNLAVTGGTIRVINLSEHILELFNELKLNTLFVVSGR